MTLDIKTVKEHLMKTYEGKEANSYQMFEIGLTIKQLLKVYYGVDQKTLDDIIIDWKGFTLNLGFRVKDAAGSFHTYNFLEVNAKRKKGTSHYRYGSSWCDYTWKDFTVAILNTGTDVIAALNKAIELANTRVEKIKDDLDHIYKIYEVLRDRYLPYNDEYAVYDILEKLYKNRYAFRDRYAAKLAKNS